MLSLQYTILFYILLHIGLAHSTPEREIPVAFQGRYRPIEAYAKLQSTDISSLWNKQLEEKPHALEIAFYKRMNDLQQLKAAPPEILRLLSQEFPLKARLQATEDTLKVLPGRHPLNEWYSPQAFKIQVYDPSTNSLKGIGNFTAFDDNTFNQLRNSFLAWEAKPSKELHHQFIDRLYIAYSSSMAGTTYLEAYGKSLQYPSLRQLRIESLYFHYPWFDILTSLYAITLILFAIRWRKAAFFTIFTAFALHSSLLLSRWIILERPPVSNMFETALYVPWIAMAAGFIFCLIHRSIMPIIAASVGSTILLSILKWTGLHDGMDNVQAVLDSQFWLVIHVLMVVGSYGLFILGGLLGHFYLLEMMYNKRSTPRMEGTAKLILESMYGGTALLVGGTILGGVWAAESWGRFWDWDPKEAWAFISCCTYLIWIHAYRFGKISNFGLALGSTIGLLSISFTWYGVNYILGTGLHSYGFGKGGEIYYYAFIFFEAAFLTTACLMRKERLSNIG